MGAIDGKIIFTNSDCYKKAQRMKPKGIVVHSTGANNTSLSRYIAPDDGIIGKNRYGNHWNQPGLDVCVHGFIGKDKNGKTKFYQTLPFDYCCWGCGSGRKGSYNYNPSYIQFEMCEDALTNSTYFNSVYNKAVEVCVYLCKLYNISVDNIVSHKEAHEKGYASNHGDPENWFSKFGKSMKNFRDDVRKKLNSSGGNVTVIVAGVLRKNPWYDDEGGTSPKVCSSVPKNAKVTYLEDDGWGWGKVTYNGKTGWIQNNRLNKKGITIWRRATFKRQVTCNKVWDAKTKKTFAKGATANFISQLNSGKNKGRDIINNGGDFYVNHQDITIGGKRYQ